MVTTTNDPLSVGTLQPVTKILSDITGRRPSPASVWRWHAKGTARNGKLPTVMLYGAVCSTEAAVRAWLAGQFAPTPLPAIELPTADDAALRAAGLL